MGDLGRTALCTVPGPCTATAFASARHRFRARGAINAPVFPPMTTPEVVTAASPVRLGARDLGAVEAAITPDGIYCAVERTGEIAIATRAHQGRELAAGLGLDSRPFAHV